jgi:hypothetical protein
MSIPAVKAALHRGRVRLRELPAEQSAQPAPPHTPAVVRYTQLFNARDWDGVRSMLVDEVKLDLVSREKRAGIRDVGSYFSNYDRIHDWHLTPDWLDGREIIAVRRAPDDAAPTYLIELTMADGRVALIRDYRYVPYLAQDLALRGPPGRGTG